MRIVVLTTGRQDWGILRSTCLALRSTQQVVVLAGGMACDEKFSRVAQLAKDEGFDVDVAPWNVSPEHIEQEMAEATGAIGAALRKLRPDAFLMVGDRYETAAAALVATAMMIPVIHLHGGEETEGALDNLFRHSISKLAALHFVSHETYAKRLRQMGEASASIVVVGAPGVDNLTRADLPTREELEADLGLALDAPLVLVTVHPSTLNQDPAADARAVCRAMAQVDATYLVTLPNSDPGSQSVRELMVAAGVGPRRLAVSSLGERRYWGLLRVADAMMGNSSSGLIEAPVVSLPVVNVGDRQAGRLRGANVLDVAAEPGRIAEALRKAVSPAFRESVRSQPPLFGDGHAGERIAKVISTWDLHTALRKRFCDDSELN